MALELEKQYHAFIGLYKESLYVQNLCFSVPRVQPDIVAMWILKNLGLTSKRRLKKKDRKLPKVWV